MVGIDDDSAGEVPLACVIVKEGHNVTEQEIIKLVGGKIHVNNSLMSHFLPSMNGV